MLRVEHHRTRFPAQADNILSIDCELISCLVAERHLDQVGWAIADNAWRFTPVSDEVL